MWLNDLLSSGAFCLVLIDLCLIEDFAGLLVDDGLDFGKLEPVPGVLKSGLSKALLGSLVDECLREESHVGAGGNALVVGSVHDYFEAGHLGQVFGGRGVLAKRHPGHLAVEDRLSFLTELGANHRFGAPRDVGIGPDVVG